MWCFGIKIKSHLQSAKRSRYKKKVAAKAFYERFHDQCERLANLEAKVAALAELVRRKRQQEAQAEAAAEAAEAIGAVEAVGPVDAVGTSVVGTSVVDASVVDASVVDASVVDASVVAVNEAVRPLNALHPGAPLQDAEPDDLVEADDLAESDYDDEINDDTHDGSVAFAVENTITTPISTPISTPIRNRGASAMQVDDGRAALTNSIHTYSPNNVEGPYAHNKCGPPRLGQRAPPPTYSVPGQSSQGHMVPFGAPSEVGLDQQRMVRNHNYAAPHGMHLAPGGHQGLVCVSGQMGGTPPCNIGNARGVDANGGRVIRQMTASTTLMDQGVVDGMMATPTSRRACAYVPTRRKEEQLVNGRNIGPGSEGGADSEHETLLLNSDMSAATLPLRMLPMTHAMGVTGTDVTMQGESDHAFGFDNELDDLMDMGGQRIFSC